MLNRLAAIVGIRALRGRLSHANIFQLKKGHPMHVPFDSRKAPFRLRRIHHESTRNTARTTYEASRTIANQRSAYSEDQRAWFRVTQGADKAEVYLSTDEIVIPRLHSDVVKAMEGSAAVPDCGKSALGSAMTSEQYRMLFVGGNFVRRYVEEPNVVVYYDADGNGVLDCVESKKVDHKLVHAFYEGYDLGAGRVLWYRRQGSATKQRGTFRVGRMVDLCDVSEQMSQ